MGIECSGEASSSHLNKKPRSPSKLAPNPHRKVYLSRVANLSKQSPSKLDHKQKVQTQSPNPAPEQLVNLCRSWPNLIGFDSIYRDSLGVLKFRDDYCNGDVFANAILISDTLLLTAARQIRSIFSDKTMYRIRYWNFTTRRQYFIEQVRLLSLFDDSSLPLRDRFHYCLIRIDRPVVCPKYPLLGINFTKDYKALFFSSFESPLSNGPSTISVKLGLTSEYNHEEGTIILPSKEEFQSNINGGQVSISVQDQMVLLGLQTSTSKDKAQNYALTFNPDFIQEIKNIADDNVQQKQISLYFFDTKKKISLFQYIQELKAMEKKCQQNYAGKDDGLLDKIQEQLKKYLALSREQQIKQQKRLFQQRMSANIDFSLEGRLVDSIDVGKHRFYYDFQKKDFTLNDLANDYEKATRSPLILQIDSISLDRNAFLQELLYKTQLFTQLLNAMNGFYKLEYIPQGIIEKIAQSPFNLNRDTRKLKSFKITIEIIKGHYLIESFPYFIYFNTTINRIKEDLSKNKPYNLQNVQVRLYPFQRIKNHDTPIPHSVESLQFTLVDLTSYIGSETDIFIEVSRQGQVSYQQVKLKSLLKSKEKVKILSYNEQKEKISYQSVTKMVQNEDFFNFCQFQYRIGKGKKGKLFTFLCSENTKIMVSQFTWRKAYQITAGDRFLGINEDMTGFIEYYIQRSRSGTSKKELAMCTLSVNSTHTFIANRLIIHNQDTFPVKVKFYLNQSNKQLELQILDVFPNQKLLTYFENYDVYLGENKLNKNFTFGELKLQSFRTLYKVLPEKNVKSKIKFKNMQFIRRYEQIKTDIEQDEQQDKEWNWIVANYYQISDGSVIPFERQQPRVSPMILLYQKFYLERERYFQLAHMHQVYESTCLIESQIKYQKQKKNNIQLQHMSEELSLRRALFFYTRFNEIYTIVNNTLRKTDITQTKTEKQQKTFAIANLIVKRLKELPSCTVPVVYRGICLQEDIEMRIDGLLLTRGFTSASLCVEIAERFAKTGCGRRFILQIKSFSGKDISNLSSNSWEAQVLIFPFTYFSIDRERKRGQFTVLQLTQVHLPFSHKNQTIVLLFQRNEERKFKQDHFTSSNRLNLIKFQDLPLFQLFLSEFLWLYLLQNRTCVLVFGDAQSEIDDFQIKIRNYGLSAQLYTTSDKPNKVELQIFMKHKHPVNVFFKYIVVYSHLLRDFY